MGARERATRGPNVHATSAAATAPGRRLLAAAASARAVDTPAADTCRGTFTWTAHLPARGPDRQLVDHRRVRPGRRARGHLRVDRLFLNRLPHRGHRPLRALGRRNDWGRG